MSKEAIEGLVESEEVRGVRPPVEELEDDWTGAEVELMVGIVGSMQEREMLDV
ncbi:hypothetical protein FQN55_008556 [Onygenales sp. PD_40]|nr:hypothetical protein FQN55_008556 [Onygenales sp. PD_40]KAK2785541.1 hypothetical protein FQN53_007626 [Emmonsiellopsis sp. PD_33]